MEKAKFLEAKKQMDIITACETIISDNKYEDINKMFPIDLNLRNSHVTKLLFLDKYITRSFLRWVENEKAIAEQKLKEI